MSRKKLKGFDPGNNNKARRSAYQELQNGGSIYNAAPRPNSDSNRLSGAARRFATQVLISKKLDVRDREKAHAQAAARRAAGGPRGPVVTAPGAAKGGGGKQPPGTDFMPDYKQALAAQIAAASERAAKKKAKDERKRAKKDAAAEQQAAAASQMRDDDDAPQSSAVSLSKSVEQQRLAKQARAADEKKRSSDAERKAAAAAATAAAAAESAAASSSNGLNAEVLPTNNVAEKVVFTTEMRPGESFRSYQARLVREKSEKMQIEVKGKKLSEKKKRKLAERDEKKKAKKDPSIDPRDLRFQAERDAKDAADAALAASRRGRSRGGDDENEDEESKEDRPAKRARTTATEFAGADSVGFGEVADRPPTLTIVPKSKTLSGKISHERIIDGLLLMQEGKPKKKGGLKGMDAAEKAEWIAKQRDTLRRKDAQEAADAANLASLREQSIAAYKAAKKKKREDDAEGKLAAEPTKEVYVKKSVIKKQKRNRERLQAFKDSADLDLDMEIEMAGGFDD